MSTWFKLEITILIFLVNLLTNPALAATQLQATVEPTQVRLGDSITLSVDLLNADSAELNRVKAPDLSALTGLFEIADGNKSIQQFNIQGQESVQLTWRYVLEPKRIGTLTIPALSVTTTTGTLYTQPLSIIVTASDSKRRDNIRLEATVSNSRPYLHQPILYTLRLYQRGDLQNVQAIPPSDSVIVESLGEMTAQRQIINGTPMVVNEIKYLLTPLRSGQLDLSSAKIKGLQPDTRSNRVNNSFFSFSTDYRPLTVSSEPLTVAVQPSPVTAPSPWLPLNNLTLAQTWESEISQPVIVGVPLIRSLTLTAAGMGAQPGPELDKLAHGPEFRSRNPKPETQRQLAADGKTPISIIKQTVSLIPLHTGKLSLPAIRIPWWNVQTHTLQWAELPAQTLEVIPSPTQTTAVPQTLPMPLVATTAAATTVTRVVSTEVNFSQLQYVLLALSILTLLMALGHSWSRRRRELTAFKNAAATSSGRMRRMSDSTLKQRLHATDELAVLKQVLQEYAQARWQTSPQISLPQLASYLIVHYENGQGVAAALTALNAALYGSQTLLLMEWRTNLISNLSRLKEIKSTGKQEEFEINRLEPFNPT